MSIENELRALTDAVEALNHNLKVMLGGNYRVVSTAPELEPTEDPAPAPKAKKAKPITPEEAIDKLMAPTKGEVIEALKQLQSVAGPAGVKALLDEHGARNVGGLAAADYGRVIEQAAALATTLEKAA